jgi:hypothetical protein
LSGAAKHPAGARPSKCIIIWNTILEIAAETIQEIDERLRAEFGWDNLTFKDEDGEEFSLDSEFKGAPIYVYEMKERQEIVRAKFPGESESEAVTDGTGAEIGDWATKQVEARCWIAVTKEEGN